MSSIPRDWRTRHQRYSLAAGACAVCGAATFPPRPVCPSCTQARGGMQLTTTPVALAVAPVAVSVPAAAAQITAGANPDQPALPPGPLTILTQRLDETGDEGQILCSYE